MTEEPLTRREDFQSLVDHLDGVAIWTVTGPGEFGYISSGFEDIWGIPVDAVLDDVSRLVESIHPADRDRLESMMAQSPDELTREEYEIRVVRPDGEVRWTLTRQFPLRDGDGDGNPTEIIGVSTDITEQKHREQELEALNRVVRHDIRNDMQIILAWAEMLEDDLDESGRERLEKVLASGEHVVELTEIAREYMKTLTDGEELPVCPVALRSTLENELHRRRESYPAAEFVLDGEIPDVDVRANEMLASVFRNLLNNAVQHNDSEVPVVEISCKRGDGDVTVSVADNGPGIPDDQKESVFGKGERGLASEGTGIGLYLVSTLVDQYGGDVEIRDNEPTGSVVDVRLAAVE
jgi:PAS domain S-box-containing protein